MTLIRFEDCIPECVGHSQYTASKHEGLRKFFPMHLRICKRIMERGNALPFYLYIDLNAGPGRSQDYTGSPILFAEAAREAGIPCRAYCCEDDPAAADALAVSLREFQTDTQRYRILRGDNKETIPALMEKFPPLPGRRRFGLVFSDTNGSPLEIGLLQHFNALEQVDILCYLAATNQKRVATVWRKERLIEAIGQLRKDYCIVREPEGRHQWTFALLTNWPDFPAMKRQGFHNIETPEGESILTRLNYTAEELSRMEFNAPIQGRLF